jgi:hypothetical protein
MRWFLGILAATFLFWAASRTLAAGIYGLLVFVALPVALGALAAVVVQPRTRGGAAGVGALANLLGSFVFLAMGIEGAICIATAAPLAMPLGALGGWLAYLPDPSDIRAHSSATMLLIVPLGLGSLGFDVTAKPDIFEVRSSIEIAATPEQVWKHVVTFAELPEPDEWYFKAGLAYPMRARIEGSGPGAIRYCEFSTGPFVEPIKVWDEPKLLRFSVTENPAPMHEWSPYANVVPKHLHGYLESKQGQFQLTRLENGRTLLEGTTWYQHGLWPAQYWRVWSDAIIHRIHLRVLNHIKNLAEGDGRL